MPRHVPCAHVTAGLVAAAPLFGGPRSNSRANRALFRTVLAATDALTMAWLLSQYAFQVRWLWCLHRLQQPVRLLSPSA